MGALASKSTVTKKVVRSVPTTETGKMVRKTARALMFLRRLARSMLEFSCKDKWSRANGSTLTLPHSKVASTIISQKVLVCGASKMETKFLVLTDKFTE